VVGIISNVNFLTQKVTFLRFIDSIPPVILGVVTGLLPVIMLAVLMALLPIWLRFLAKTSGLPTLSQVELRVQTSYFWFQVCSLCHCREVVVANILQVIQVFLVTTLSSAVSKAIQPILNNPASVTTLLATNLPLASNFYIYYFILQGLACKFPLALAKRQVANWTSCFRRLTTNRWVDSVQDTREDPRQDTEKDISALGHSQPLGLGNGLSNHQVCC
jgi:Calcium-dependent channel, 7TM region, putative phosphate